MTVQQSHSVEPAAPSTVALPQQRTGEHDAPSAVPAPPVRQLQGWGTPSDRTMMASVMVGMVLLALYAGLMIWLGTRVW